MRDVDVFKVNNVNVANIKNDSEIVFFSIATLNGSNFETRKIAGISHYAEHLFFKGTTKRTWKDINKEFALLGASQNAYTSNYEVLYHAGCPKENIGGLIALMTDMFFNSTFPDEEFEKERNVIMEEKKMYEDNPKLAFYNTVGDNMFKWQVGHDTIGTFDSIKNITKKEVQQYLTKTINLDNFVFICSGNIKSGDLKKHILKNLPDKHDFLRQGNGLNSVNVKNMWNKDILNNSDKIKLSIKRDNITQSNVLMIADGLSYEHPLFLAQDILLEALGGGMFSYLFSRIREEMGLCYSVGSYLNVIHFPNMVTVNIYGDTSPKNIDKFILESEKILAKIAIDGIDNETFQCAKNNYLSNFLKQTETSTGKSMSFTKKILVYKNASIKDKINNIRKVKIDDCNEVAKLIFNNKYNWAAMNPKK